MTPYTPPTADQLLAIRVNAGIEELAQSERFAHARTRSGRSHRRRPWGNSPPGEFAPLNRNRRSLEGAKLRRTAWCPARRVQGGLQWPMSEQGLEERDCLACGARLVRACPSHCRANVLGKPRRGQYGL